MAIETVGDTIPLGGPPGPVNVLTVRNVSTGAAGSQAAAQINGVAPTQTLDLTIPKGDPGATGPVPWAPILAWYTGQICTATAPATLVYVGGTAYVCAITHIAGTFAADLAAGRWAQVAPGGLQPWKTPPVAWAASTAYTASAPADTVTNGGNLYICSTSHTSGASFDSSKWVLAAQAGAASAGALLAANNLSDLGSVTAALQNLLQAPASPNASASFAAGDVERIVRPTGTITRTLPASVPAGWNTDVILNDGTGIVTVAVPAGGILDGVTNGSTLIFPKQRARFFYDADGWRTVWIERSPLLLVQLITSAVALADFTLPAGYGSFDILITGWKPGTNGAALNARFSDDNGATFKAGASDYSTALTEFYSSTSYTASANASSLILIGQTGTTGNGGLADVKLYPGGGANAGLLSRASYYYYGGAYATCLGGGNVNATTNRITTLRLFPGSGTALFNVTIRGNP